MNACVRFCRVNADNVCVRCGRAFVGEVADRIDAARRERRALHGAAQILVETRTEGPSVQEFREETTPLPESAAEILGWRR